MSAERLMEMLERRGVLSDRLLVKLRAKVAESDRPMSAKALAQFLVQKKHLRSQQAHDLLNLLQSEMPDESEEPGSVRRQSGDRPEPAADKVDPAEPEDAEDSSIFSAFLASKSQSRRGREETGPDDFSLAPVEEEAEDPELAKRRAAEIRRQKLSPVDDLEELSASKSFRGEQKELMQDPLVAETNLAAGSAALRSTPSSILRSTRRDEERVRKKIEKQLADRSKRGERAESKRKKPSKSKNEWESPLLLIGGGVLTLLILCGVTVFMILRWETGEDQLKLADAKLAEGSYTQAIPLYDEFLKDFPNHAEWSTARVKLAMARLRRDTESGNFEIALRTAQEELDDVEDEPKFGEVANAELAALLPRIARGLADRAEASADDPEQAEQWTDAANQALALCLNTKFVLKSLRDDAELDLVEETLARVARQQQSRRELFDALEAMKSANASGDTRAAYAAHRQLLEQHPEWTGNEALTAAVAATSAAEQAGIKFIVDEQRAETTERPTPWVAALATANRRGGVNSAAGGTFCVRVDGAVYGLDVSTGQLLWRRYVGFAVAAPPITLGEHVLVADSKYHELARLDARTGRLVWRQVFDEPFAVPLCVGGRAFVSAESGRLYVVDLESGQRMGYLQFAQPLRVPPVVDRQGERLYLTGEHSSVYTISLKDLTCQGVFYLGHSAGSIRVPPALVLDKLALLENSGVATCRLRLLSLDEQGAVSKRQAQHRLTGLAAAAPLVAGRRVVVVTDRGQLDAFDVAAGNGNQSLTLVATREATSQQPIVRHVMLTQSAIWVGDTRLTKYAVLPTGNRLPVESIDNNYAGATFDHPFGLFGTTLVHVRRPANRAGVAVAAMDADGGDSLWETDLAMPPVATPIVHDAGRTLAFADANAVVFRFDEQAIRSRVQDQPLAPLDAPALLPKLTVGVDLGDGRAAFAAPGESDQLLLYNPAENNGVARWIKLPGTIACAVSAFGNGLVVPLEVGQVFYADPADGESLAMPFQPRLQPRTKLRYQPAAAVDQAGRQFVITDGHEKIYLVALVEQPQPHLTAVTEASVGPHPIRSPVYVIGDMAIALTTGSSLARFQLPTLELAGTTDMPSDVVWGPHPLGDLLLLATANERLVAVRGDGSIAWTSPLDGGDLAGPPLASKQDVLLAYRSGTVERRSLTDGQPNAKLDVEHPLAAGPVRYAGRIVLTAHDGTLLVVDEP